MISTVMHDQTILNKYFSSSWGSSLSGYVHSGYAVLDRISPTDHVIDVGCGPNFFKGRLPHVVGVDPAHPNADVYSTIEEFETDRLFDVALCFGSINFGTEDIITKQIDKINSLLKPSAKVFWRLNPGFYDHHNSEQYKIHLYAWSFPRLNKFAEQYGFTQMNCAYDTNGQNLRLYAEWIR